MERRAIKRELLMKMSEEIKIIEEEPPNIDDSMIKSPVKQVEAATISENKKKKKASAKKKNEEEPPVAVSVQKTTTSKVEEVKKPDVVKETTKDVEEDSWNVVQAKKKV